MKRTLTLAGVIGVALTVACAPAGPDGTDAPGGESAMSSESHGGTGDIGERLAQYAPTDLSADLSGVPEGEVEVLKEIIRAARIMDDIFLEQVWQSGSAMRAELADGDEDLLRFFDINFGPWDRLAENQPFIGEQEHPAGAGYYPEDMTKEEFEAWLEAHPDDRAALTGLFTMVRRDGEGLVAIPYSAEFDEYLEAAAGNLRRAAELTQNESLKTFLTSRANAFFSDDYYQSDKDWMDLESPVEVTIGPYETYEDGLFGYKAAFEAFVTVNLPEESAKLERFKSFLPWLESNLPIPDKLKNERGTDSPIRVVDEVYVGGDSKAGVQTLAFNLPNDERVREEKGSKKVMLRNVLRAKYEKILVPIAERVIASEQIDDVSFNAFFAEVLHHELSHGLGPGKITVDGSETEVRLELKELYSTLEEAKADVMGVYNILALIDRGEIGPEMRATLEPSYVAGLFRSARFGLHEAHGRGVVAQFNFLLEKGALEIDEDGRFRAVSEKFGDGIRDLLETMLMLQANGDYEGTKVFLDTYGVASDALVSAIDRLEDVPVDIYPIFSQADELSPAS